MNKEEFLRKIEMAYVGDRNALDECVTSYNEIVERENQLKEQLHESSIKIQELIEQDISCPTSCKKLQRRDEVIEEAINHLDCFISDTNLSKYDTLKILMYTKKILNKCKNKES